MANTKKMTITKGLVELKLYDSKITKAIQQAFFISCKKKRDKMIGTMKVEDFEAKAKESFQSIMDMMKNRDAIKRAIVLSNATTQITVAGETMTVAEAIEKRNLNNLPALLINKMGNDLISNETYVRNKNAEVDAQAEKMLNSYYGKDAAKKISKEDYANIVDPFKEANEFEVIDPLGLRELYESMNKKHEEFFASVDIALSVSNATTYIEVEV